MPRELKIRGYLLKQFSLGDVDEILTIFSKEEGKLRAKAVSVRKIKSRLRSSLLPASEIEFRVVGNSQLPVVSSAHCIQVFTEVWKSQGKSEFYFWFMEVIDKAVPDREVDERLYILIGKVLAHLQNISDALLSVYTCYVVVRLCEIFGFGFQVNNVNSNAIDVADRSNNLQSLEELFHINERMFKLIENLVNLRVEELSNFIIEESDLESLRVILFNYLSYNLERKINSSGLLSY